MGGLDNVVLFLVWCLSVLIPIAAVVCIIVLLLRIDRRVANIESRLHEREG